MRPAPTFVPQSALAILCFVSLGTGERSAHGHPFGGFSSHADYAADNDPTDIVAGDFDADGNCDLAIVDANETGAIGNMRVLINAGDGTFALGASVALGCEPKAIAAGDLDNDGDLDLAAANWCGNTVMVLLNDGSGSFAINGIPYDVGIAPRDIAVVDLDGDCDLDLILTNQFGHSCSVLTNDGSGTFAAGDPVPTGDRPSFLALADLDGDGDVDLVVSNEDSDEVWVMLNDGSGSFSGPSGGSPFPMVDPENIVIVDLDADKDPDVAVVTQQSVVRVLLNDGSAGFVLQAQAYPAGNGAGLAIADVDPDGDPDLVAGHSFDDDVLVLLNNGDAKFANPRVFAAGDALRAVAVADLDGDWDVDVATANAENGDSVSVLLNRSGQCPPGDLNGDCCVTIVDLMTLLAEWAEQPPCN